MRMIEIKVEGGREPRSVWYNAERIVAVSRIEDTTFFDVDSGGTEVNTIRTAEPVESLVTRLCGMSPDMRWDRVRAYRCDKELTKNSRWCTLPVGHPGVHRDLERGQEYLGLCNVIFDEREATFARCEKPAGHEGPHVGDAKTKGA